MVRCRRATTGRTTRDEQLQAERSFDPATEFNAGFVRVVGGGVIDAEHRHNIKQLPTGRTNGHVGVATEAKPLLNSAPAWLETAGHRHRSLRGLPHR